MYINERINQKYKNELEAFMQCNPFDMIEALNHFFIVMISQKRIILIFLDYLVETYKDNKAIKSLGDKDFSLERMVLDLDMIEYLENWDIHTQNKYFKYFKSRENMMSLADWPEPIFDYYKDDLNWDIILYNTFFIEWDNYDAYTLIFDRKVSKRDI